LRAPKPFDGSQFTELAELPNHSVSNGGSDKHLLGAPRARLDLSEQGEQVLPNLFCFR
jgi:hypothetical protein